MIGQFISDLGSISAILPPLVRILIVTTILTMVWVVLSIPTFWLCRTLGISLYAAEAKLYAARQKLFGIAYATINSCSVPINRFVTEHSQMFSFANENMHIRSEIAKVRFAAEGIPTKLQALESSIVDAANKFSGAAEWITHLEVPAPVSAPGAQEFATVQKGRNKAVVVLIAALVVLPPLIVFNTFMLSQFLEGFEQGVELFGVPFSMALALFLTVIEITLGIMHAKASGPRAQFGWLVAIAGLAFSECTFYALMGQGFNRSLFDAFYAPNPAPAWTKMWFGVLGPILVAGLAGVGHALFTSITQLAESHVVRQWKGYITNRMRSAKELRERLSDAERAKSLLIGSLSDVQISLSATTDISTSNVAIIEKAKEDLLQQVKRAEVIRLEDTRRLDRGAMLRQFIESLACFLGIVIALMTLASVYSTAIVASPLLGLTGWWLGGSVAFAQGAMLLIAGSALSRASATLPAGDGIPASSLPTSRFGLIAGLSILIVCIVGNAAYVLGTLSAINFLLLALLVAADVALLWCGTKLGLIGASVWAFILSVTHVLAAGSIALLAALVAFGEVLLKLLRVALLIVGYPFSLIFFRDGSGARLIPRPAA